MIKENLSKAWKIFYKEKYPKFWIKQSSAYLERKTARSYVNEIIRFINPARREKILECGIGTGEPMALWLAQNETEIFEVDIAFSLLLICKRKFKNKGLKVNCISADIEKGLAGMVRVTKKGGIIVFDIINLLHPTQIMSYYYSIMFNLASKIKRKLEGRTTEGCFVNYIARTHFQMVRILEKLDVKYKMKGFFILLPLSLLYLGEKANLCKYSHLFSYGLQDSILKYLGAKLVYICEKQ